MSESETTIDSAETTDSPSTPDRRETILSCAAIGDLELSIYIQRPANMPDRVASRIRRHLASCDDCLTRFADRLTTLADPQSDYLTPEEIKAVASRPAIGPGPSPKERLANIKERINGNAMEGAVDLQKFVPS